MTVTNEQVGLAIVNVLSDPTKTEELDPENRPGLYGVRGRAKFRSLLPVDMRHRTREGGKWVNRQGQYGLFVCEPHGHFPAFYFLLTDPAQISEYQRRARFQTRYITSRTRTFRDETETAVTMAGVPEGVMNAVRGAAAAEQANREAGVRLLADALHVPATEAEQVWLGIKTAQPDGAPV